jgi:hypothetical protein
MAPETQTSVPRVRLEPRIAVLERARQTARGGERIRCGMTPQLAQVLAHGRALSERGASLVSVTKQLINKVATRPLGMRRCTRPCTALCKVESQ